MKQTSGPLWPYIYGPIAIILGTVLGFTVPVGPKCAGAFSGDHMEAAGYDIASAMVTGKSTHFAEACSAAAPDQRGMYWAIIGFGIAIIILGVILNTPKREPVVVVQQRPQMLQQPPASVSTELMRLVSLRDQGAITAAEFETLKHNLIGRP